METEGTLSNAWDQHLASGFAAKSRRSSTGDGGAVRSHSRAKSKEVLLMPVTTGMKGAGFYDRHSGAQMAGIQALDDWVDDAVANVPLPAAGRPVSVLDLGSSEGGNAIRLMAGIVGGLRRRTDQPLQTIYSDLAGNDFNRLFANLEEARRSGLVAAGVYPGAVAAYAGAYTGFLRAHSEPVVRASLNGPDGEVGAVECLYERIHARLLADPEAPRLFGGAIQNPGGCPVDASVNGAATPWVRRNGSPVWFPKMAERLAERFDPFQDPCLSRPPLAARRVGD